jgi:hypothetical protein
MADADLVEAPLEAPMEQPACFPVALGLSFETSGARVKALHIVGKASSGCLTWPEMQRSCISHEAWVVFYLAVERRAQDGYISSCLSTPVVQYCKAIVSCYS